MNHINLTTIKWIRGGVQCLRNSIGKQGSHFYLWTTDKDSGEKHYYSIRYNPNRFKIKVGKEYLFGIERRGGEYILNGLTPR